MLQRLLVFACLALVATPAVSVPDRPSAGVKRGAYIVKFAAAKDLAAILAKHFKDAAEIQAGPDGTSRCLLVSAPPVIFEEVMKTIEQLDHRPHLVTVDVLVIELPVKKPDDTAKGLDEKEFTGAFDDVAARIEALQKKGDVAAVKRVQLTTLEGQSSTLMLGEYKPYVSGSVNRPGGATSRTINYRNMGTQFRVTPLVGPDAITLDLQVSDSRMRSSESLPAVGVDEKGQPIPATEFTQTSLASKINVTSGKAALAKDSKVTSKEGQGQMRIVVGARIVDPGAKSK
jgi:type II secretory pathway component GspD/PulD (secretin)